MQFNIHIYQTQRDRLSSLQWRHNGLDGSSNHQPHDFLLKRLFKAQIKETSKLRVIGLCVGNLPVTGEFPAQRASDAENVSIWWRHHEICYLPHSHSATKIHQSKNPYTQCFIHKMIVSTRVIFLVLKFPIGCISRWTFLNVFLHLVSNGNDKSVLIIVYVFNVCK